MEKRLLHLFLALVCVVTQAAAMTGSGTAADPYLISSAADLVTFRDKVNASTNNAGLCAKLTADIDLASVCGANVGTSGTDWIPMANEDKVNGTPVYSYYNGYTGTFDGNGKTISGLYVNAPEPNSQALFCNMYGTVKNLTVVSNITGRSSGAAIAVNNYGTVTGCTTKGTITATGSAGGVVSSNMKDVEYCTNEATVTSSTDPQAGGIAAFSNTAASVINCCVNKGTITNTGKYGTDVGGIIGYGGCIITNCCNMAAVTGLGYVGGIAGNFLSEANCRISNCYNTADVTSTATIFHDRWGEHSYSSSAG